MKIRGSIFVAVFSLTLIGCPRQDTANVPAVPPPKMTERPAQKTVSSPTPAPTAMPTPKNGDYPGKGKITKITNEPGSVELDHKEIVGVMPPMLMEFYVTDKAMLKGLSVGDDVNFMLRYKDGQETISKIEKAK